MKTLPLVIAAAAAVAVGLTGCGSAEDEAGTGTDTTGIDADQPADDSGDDILPAGSTVQVGDWSVTMGETVPDATDDVLAASDLTVPPASGRQFVLVTVTATYQGTEATAAPWADLWLTFSGPDGTVYDAVAEEESSCGIIDGGLDDYDAVATDEQVTGDVCVSVPAEAVADGYWIVQDLFEEYTYYIEHS